MKKIFNAENITSLTVVVIGVIIATIVGPTVIGWFNRARNTVAS